MPKIELVRAKAEQTIFLKEDILKLLTSRREIDAGAFIKIFQMRGFTTQDVRDAMDELKTENKIREIP